MRRVLKELPTPHVPHDAFVPHRARQNGIVRRKFHPATAYCAVHSEHIMPRTLSVHHLHNRGGIINGPPDRGIRTGKDPMTLGTVNGQKESLPYLASRGQGSHQTVRTTWFVQLQGNQEDRRNSPLNRATKTRVTLKHVDAAAYSLERAVDIPRTGRFHGERPIEQQGWVRDGRHFQSLRGFLLKYMKQHQQVYSSSK